MSSYTQGPPRDEGYYRESDPRDDQYSSPGERYQPSHAPRRYIDEESSYAPPPRYSDRDYSPARSHTSGRHGTRSVVDDEYAEDRQLARYDHDKAYAEYRRGEDDRDDYRSERALDYRRRPSDDYEYEERPHHHHRDYDDRERAFDDRQRGAGHDKKHNELIPTLIGAGGGAFIGHEIVGKGALGTVGGAVVGALAARGFEHHEEKKHRERELEEERRHQRREYDY